MYLRSYICMYVILENNCACGLKNLENAIDAIATLLFMTLI